MLDPTEQGHEERVDPARQSSEPPEALTALLTGSANRHLFLDLEDTIITPVVNGWGNVQFINIQKIQRFIETFKPEQVSIFSFAIWNKFELGRFEFFVRPRMEELLGFKLSMIPTVDDHIIPICCEQMGMTKGTVDFAEASNFWGKQGAFRHFARHHAKRMQAHNLTLHAVLLDDVVYNETVTWPDLVATVQQFNIDQL